MCGLVPVPRRAPGDLSGLRFRIFDQLLRRLSARSPGREDHERRVADVDDVREIARAVRRTSSQASGCSRCGAEFGEQQRVAVGDGRPRDRPAPIDAARARAVIDDDCSRHASVSLRADRRAEDVVRCAGRKRDHSSARPSRDNPAARWPPACKPPPFTTIHSNWLSIFFTLATAALCWWAAPTLTMNRARRPLLSYAHPTMNKLSAWVERALHVSASIRSCPASNPACCTP